MSAQHTPGRLEPFILDIPLADIPAYVEQCIKASGGANFYFLSAVDPDLGPVDVAHIGNGPRGGANARRLAACWNACDGIRTEALEHRSHLLKAEDDQITILATQRDELLAALEDAVSVCQSVSISCDRRIVRDGCTLYAQTEEWCKRLKDEVGPRLIAAIAKVEGGAA